MKNVYKVAPTWRYIMIGSFAGLVLVFLLPVLSRMTSIDFLWSALLAGGISGALTYGVVTSKIITSPEGIECISFGMRVQETWDKVEKVDINPYGLVNLIFKESLYKNWFVNTLLHPLTYDRIIQLSPYMEDLATSNLFREIESYVSASRLPKSITKHKRGRKSYQKVGSLGLYYLGWLPVLIILNIAFQKWAEDLEGLGLSHMTSVSQIITISLFIGLIANGMGLFGYNSEIVGLNESKASHLARAYYLGPIVALLLGFLVGMGIWFTIRAGLLVVSENSYGIFSLVGILTAGISLRVNQPLERLLFRS